MIFTALVMGRGRLLCAWSCGLEEGLEERGGLGEDQVRTGGWALVVMAAIVVRALVVNALVGMALLALPVLVGMALLGNTLPVSATHVPLASCMLNGECVGIKACTEPTLAACSRLTLGQDVCRVAASVSCATG